jgi:hypothetical protein
MKTKIAIITLTAIISLIGCAGQYDDIVKRGTDRALGDSDYYPINGDEYPGSEPTIVLMGDSRIDRMDVRKCFPNNHIINLALGGTSSVNTLGRIPVVKQYNPKIIFISTGINDITKGFSGDYEQRMVQIITELQSSCPEAVIYVTKVVPPVYGSSLFLTTLQMNKNIERVCIELGAIFVDTKDMEDVNGGLKINYSIDEVHYSEEGYTKFFEIIHRYF